MTAMSAKYPKYEVAIVGGGIAGIYCGWKLAKAGRRVVIYERSKRWGGRISTESMGKFKAEFGPMRFESVGQKRLMGLLKELNLDISPFPQYESANTAWPQYNITDTEEKRWSNPMDLFLMGILKVLGLYKAGMSRQGMRKQVMLYDEASYPTLRKTKQFEGRPLYTYGLWNVLSDVLSHQALLKIRDTGNFYHMIGENPNAIEWIIFWLRGFRTDDKLVGIDGGSAELVEKLMERLLNESATHRPVIHNNHTLKAIRQEGSEVRLELTSSDRETTYALADHVILALPKRSLEALAQDFSDEVKRHIEAVRGIPLLKCFFVFSKPWWNEDTKPHTHAENMPVRELHYYQEFVLQLSQISRKQLMRKTVPPDLLDGFAKKGLSQDGLRVFPKPQKARAPGWFLAQKDDARDNPRYFIRKEDLSVFDRHGEGMVLVYTDRPATEYWSPYLQEREAHDKPERGLSDGLKQRFIKYFSRIDSRVLKGESQVLSFGIHDWGCDPYGGAFHFWRPGVKSWEVMEDLRAFDVVGGSGKRLHICGEAFSDYQAFVEGALRSADLVLAEVLSEDLQQEVAAADSQSTLSGRRRTSRGSRIRSRGRDKHRLDPDRPTPPPSRSRRK
jgi:monoamine oxidase